MAFVEDLQEIVPVRRGRAEQPPVVEDEQIDAAEVLRKPRMASVAARQREGLEQPRHALVEDRSVVAARLVAERRGQPTLADAGRAHDILPKNIRSKLSFNIRIIHAPVSASLL